MAFILALVIGAFIAIFLLLFFTTKNSGRRRFSAVVSVILFLLFVTIPFGFQTVETGQVAVVKEFGKVKEVKLPGLFWLFYPVNTVEFYDTKIQQIDMLAIAYSQDAQTMDAKLSIQFRIRVDKIEEINSEFGSLEVLSKRIQAVSEEKLKVVLSSESAMKLIEGRSGLSMAVEEKIKENISQYYVDITMVAVTDISFNDAFEQAVENKMIAEQEKLKAEYDKAKAIIKAEEDLEVAIKAAMAKIETARGDAQAMMDMAQAEAISIQSKSIEVARMLGFTINEDNSINMDGKTADEIKVISEYIRYIEYLAVWNGVLPTVIGGDSSFIIPIP